jgi:hypothetical protein
LTAGAPFDLVPFDPADVKHAGFVYDTFRYSTDHWPWSEMSRPRLQERLRRELGAPGTVTCIATPHGMPESFLGWYSVRPPSTVVFAFTRYSARTKPSMEKKNKARVCAKALRMMGVTICRNADPIGLVFWTGISARIAASGWAIYFDTRGAYDDAH